MFAPNPHIYPAIEEFTAHYAKGQPQLIWTRLVADLETPVSAMLKLMEDGKPCFLLESVEGGEVRGRYSIIGLTPDLIWRCRGQNAEINQHGTLKDEDFAPCKETSLVSLKKLIRDTRLPIPAGLPPMAAGLIGYLTYDMVKLMERLPDAKPATINIPDACLMRPTIMAIFDSVAGVIFIVTPVWAGEEKLDAHAAYGHARTRVQKVMQKLAEPLSSDEAFHEEEIKPLTFTSNLSRAQYATMVERAKKYIAAGDIFQVVPSQRFSASYDLPPFALYRAVRHLNPSPFLFYLHFGTFTLIGASPEILVRLRHGKITIRPIAGTRKRGASQEEDAALERELLADPKEIAEHLMLLDLGRNDTGRVGKTGSVKVTQRMVTERYSHVMHIVSNVEADIRDDCDAVDALVAGFPAGTVSGAPKIRAMEIIDELEPEKRCFYGGCVGYFSAGGDMDTCIALRTGLITDGKLYIQAGGGVVADSDPDAEYEESLNKARALMRAAEEAAKFA